MYRSRKYPLRRNKYRTYDTYKKLDSNLLHKPTRILINEVEVTNFSVCKNCVAYALRSRSSATEKKR